MQAHFCETDVFHTVKEVQVDKELIMAVFRNDQKHQRSKEKLADRHVGVHVKTPERASSKVK